MREVIFAEIFSFSSLVIKAISLEMCFRIDSKISLLVRENFSGSLALSKNSCFKIIKFLPGSF